MKYDGTNVVVVGGAGFLGSHLVSYLKTAYNCEVTVIDNLVVGQRRFCQDADRFIHEDITHSEERLARIFQEIKADFVFNYAAYPYIPDCYDRPQRVFQVNANGAINVIQAAHEAGVKGILQVSSAEIYGEARDGTMINEKHKVTPKSTYGVAKQAVDSFVQSAWKERRTRAIALRQFNCVGAKETHPYVVPEIISQVSKRVDLFELIYLGNNSRRDFMWAWDAVRIAAELLWETWFRSTHQDHYWGEVYNLGNESSIKIYDLARKIGELMVGEEPQIVLDPKRERADEIWHLCSDNEKVRRFLGEKAYGNLYSLDYALKEAINDYRKNGWIWEDK